MVSSLISFFVARYTAVGEGEVEVRVHGANMVANVTKQVPHIRAVLRVSKERAVGKSVKETASQCKFAGVANHGGGVDASREEDRADHISGLQPLRGRRCSKILQA